MNNLSTGDPSTLASYLMLTKRVFGDDSAATKYVERLIEVSAGPDEEVMSDETQMVNLLLEVHRVGLTK